MMKMNLAILALFVSFNVNAANNPLSTQDVNHAIHSSIVKSSLSNPNTTAMVYGGKDIARSVVASAHESTWTKQQALAG